MMRRAGVRRWLRWAALAATVILPQAWAASLLGGLSYNCGYGSLVAGVGVSAGSLNFWKGITGKQGWHAVWFNSKAGVPVIWRPRLTWVGGSALLNIPLWIPWLTLAAVGVWRWRADRAPPAFACARCGYDRRGIAGACPECGAVRQTR